MAKLAKNDWLDHGLATLESSGFTALKADLLAKSLGVSRGSFYHHFADLATFHTGVLHRWLERSISLAVELEEGGLEPNAKLRSMIQRVADDDERLEQAIRAWAFSDATVAELVKEVDTARMAYTTQILVEAGLDDETAQRRTVLVYLGNVGHKFLRGLLQPEDRKKVVDDLVAMATGQ